MKRARLVGALERDTALEAGSDTLEDGDIIELQMIAINTLEDELNSLETENTRLRALNREQTASRVRVLKEVVRHRGVQLREHGEFLVRIAHSGLAECRELSNGV